MKLVAWIGRCKSCKGVVRVAAEHVSRERFDRGGALKGWTFRVRAAGALLAVADSGQFDGFAVRCFCSSGHAVFSPIYGETCEKKCGAACRNARGGSCECACGGENHGLAHAA